MENELKYLDPGQEGREFGSDLLRVLKYSREGSGVSGHSCQRVQCRTRHIFCGICQVNTRLNEFCRGSHIFVRACTYKDLGQDRQQASKIFNLFLQQNMFADPEGSCMRLWRPKFLSKKSSNPMMAITSTMRSVVGRPVNLQSRGLPLSIS